MGIAYPTTQSGDSFGMESGSEIPAYLLKPGKIKFIVYAINRKTDDRLTGEVTFTITNQAVSP